MTENNDYRPLSLMLVEYKDGNYSLNLYLETHLYF